MTNERTNERQTERSHHIEPFCEWKQSRDKFQSLERFKMKLNPQQNKSIISCFVLFEIKQGMNRLSKTWIKKKPAVWLVYVESFVGSTQYTQRCEDWISKSSTLSLVHVLDSRIQQNFSFWFFIRNLLPWSVIFFLFLVKHNE